MNAMQRQIEVGHKWGEWSFDGENIALRRHDRDRMWYSVADVGNDAKAFDMVRHFHRKAWVTSEIIADFVRAVCALRDQEKHKGLAA